MTVEQKAASGNVLSFNTKHKALNLEGWDYGTSARDLDTWLDNEDKPIIFTFKQRSKQRPFSVTKEDKQGNSITYKGVGVKFDLIQVGSNNVKPNINNLTELLIIQHKASKVDYPLSVDIAGVSVINPKATATIEKGVYTFLPMS